MSSAPRHQGEFKMHRFFCEGLNAKIEVMLFLVSLVPQTAMFKNTLKVAFGLKFTASVQVHRH
jgi:hypothetical protein